MIYARNTMGIAEMRALEAVGMKTDEQAAEQEKQAAKLDYIAMMADIDLSAIMTDDEEEDISDEE